MAAPAPMDFLWKTQAAFLFHFPPPMPYHAEFEQWIPVPLEKVFPFFADPMNLPRIMPAWMQVKIDAIELVPPSDPSAAHFAGTGTKLLASYRALPFLPMRIRSGAEIVGFARNESFADVQTKGPFRSWHHRHEFAAESRGGIAGTRLRDRIEYEIGLEPLGSVLNALFIAPQMRRTFAYRQRAVEQFLVDAT